MTGRLKDLTMNRDGTQNITVTINADFRNEYDDLSKGEIRIEIKKNSGRRSLDASARAWCIIDKIAECTGVSKNQVYRNAIREIGGVSDVVCVKNEAVQKLCEGWAEHGIGWQYDTEPSKLEGCTNVTLYYGSSVYDVQQMRALIDSLTQEAEAIGISTMSPDEQEKLLERWGKKIEKKKKKE